MTLIVFSLIYLFSCLIKVIADSVAFTYKTLTIYIKERNCLKLEYYTDEDKSILRFFGNENIS